METNAIVGCFGEIFGRVERLMLFHCRGDEQVDHLRVARKRVDTERMRVMECGEELGKLRSRYDIGRTADDVVDALEQEDGWMNSPYWLKTRDRYIREELDDEEDGESFYIIEDVVRRDVERLSERLDDLCDALGAVEQWEKWVMRDSLTSQPSTLNTQPS